MEQKSINKNREIIEVEGKYAYVVDNGKKTILSDMNQVLEQNLSHVSATIITKDESNEKMDAALFPFPTLPSGRFPFNYESRVGDLESHRMSTNGAFDPKTGYITAQTRTWTWTLFGGFTGGVNLAFFDSEDVIITYSPVHRFGVNGRWVPGGPSDRNDAWNDYINLNDASRTQKVLVLHSHAPRSIEDTLNLAIRIAKKSGELLKELSGLASVSQFFFKK